MKTLLLLCASLLFDVGLTTVQANPVPAAQAVTAAVQSMDPCCCPEWLCRLICPILCPECQPCAPQSCQAPCAPSGNSCASSCSPHCCGR